MTDDRENMTYQVVHRMVIWDEPKEDVFHFLETNGIAGKAANELYEMARADRISSIRRAALGRIALGFFCVAGAIGLFCVFWHGLGFISHKLAGICALAAAFGTWKFIDGWASFFMASTKSGSLADDD